MDGWRIFPMEVSRGALLRRLEAVCLVVRPRLAVLADLIQRFLDQLPRANLAIE